MIGPFEKLVAEFKRNASDQMEGNARNRDRRFLEDGLDAGGAGRIVLLKNEDRARVEYVEVFAKRAALAIEIAICIPRSVLPLFGAPTIKDAPCAGRMRSISGRAFGTSSIRISPTDRTAGTPSRADR